MASLPPLPTHHVAVGIESPSPTLPHKLTTLTLATPQQVDLAVDQVLVRVSYTTLSPVDLYGINHGAFVDGFPMIFGRLFAGTIVRKGSEVNDFDVGNEVSGFQPESGITAGGWQEYLVIREFSIGKIPENLDAQALCHVPGNLVTAIWAVFGPESLGIDIPSPFPVTLPSNPTRSEPVLVWGGGSSVGQYAIQVLRLAGFSNILTCASVKHSSLLHSLGAKKVFDYSDPAVVDKILDYLDKKASKVENMKNYHTQSIPLETLKKLLTR